MGRRNGGVYSTGFSTFCGDSYAEVKVWGVSVSTDCDKCKVCDKYNSRSRVLRLGVLSFLWRPAAIVGQVPLESWKAIPAFGE